MKARSSVANLTVLAVFGFLAAQAFPGRSWWPLLFPAVGVLVQTISRVKPGRAAAYSAWWAMWFMMPMISWTMVATGNTWIAWFTLSAAEAFFIGLWGLTFAAASQLRPARGPFRQAAVAALLWVTFEEMRSRIPFGGFPWGKLAYPQVDSPLVAFAPLGGEVLVSFLVVLIGSLLIWPVLSFTQPSGAATADGVPLKLLALRVSATFVALRLLIAPAGFQLPVSAEQGTLKVGIVQGNVEIPMEETFSIPRKVTGNHAAESHRMLADEPQLDVIIWGENAADIDPRLDPETQDLIGDVALRAGVPILFGMMETDGDTIYNWTAVWDPTEGLLDEMYGKQHPVPWGEYIPFRQLTQILATAAARVTLDMSAVDNPALLDVSLADGRVVPLVVAICFEVAYEPLVHEGVAGGGEAIIIPTNNSHFRDTDESVQQLQMGQFRAAEFSRALIQASTNGVSAVVMPDGTVVEATSTQESAHIVADIPLRSYITPFALVGDWLPIAVMLFGSMFAAAVFYLYLAKTRNSRS